ncbi:hypothetical protein Tco_1393550 [Tanacetum coccineum]
MLEAGAGRNRGNHRNGDLSEECSETNKSSSESDASLQRRRRNRKRIDDSRDIKVDPLNFEGYDEKKALKPVVVKLKKYASLWFENVEHEKERRGLRRDACKMAITMDKQAKKRVPYKPISRLTFLAINYTSKEFESASRSLKGKEKIGEESKDPKGNKCFKREIETEDEQPVFDESNEEETVEANCGEIMVVRRAMHTVELDNRWMKLRKCSLDLHVYHDEITCDVVPMDACHLLPGRSWLFDKHMYHNGHLNTYSLFINGKKITLISLNPNEISKVEMNTKSDKVLFMSQKEVVKRTRKCKLVDVFLKELLSSLPPIRGIEHQIDLVPGSILPNKAAYRCFPHEAKELQKQVDELVAQGIAINNITIKYMYPIPRLDDMLNELHGSCVFFNIDLRSGYVSGFFQNQASTSGTLPSNTIPNPKGEMKAITTRSGVAYEGPSIPTNPSPKKFPGMNVIVTPWTILARALKFYAPLPFGKLSLSGTTLTRRTLELADRSITHPKGVVEDVFVKVGSFHFPTDFVVVDFRSLILMYPLILEIPFQDGRALIDVYEGEAYFKGRSKDNNNSILKEDVQEENFQVYSNPLFEFDDNYNFSDVNPLFDKVLEDIECKDSYDSNLDESTFLVTPLFDSNEDECLAPGDDIEFLLHHDPSTLMKSIASILEWIINEHLSKENDRLFALEM